MENKEMDVFARAMPFLYETALKKEGIKADLKVTWTTDSGQADGQTA